MLIGRKHSTVRVYKENTHAVWIARMKSRTLLRAQSNWARSTIFGWIGITGISVGSPERIITDEVRKACGCAHLSYAQYISKYIKEDALTGTTPSQVILVHFRLWNLQAVEIISKL